MKNTMMTLVEMIDTALFNLLAHVGGFVLLNFDKIILSLVPIVALIVIHSFCTR
jgi:hypothetical protein